MNVDAYPVVAGNEDFSLFEFVSIGKYGAIVKQVTFIFMGSTEERTRLYRIAVSLNFEELSAVYDVYARIEGAEEFVPFEKGLKINAFLIKRKFIKFTI